MISFQIDITKPNWLEEASESSFEVWDRVCNEFSVAGRNLKGRCAQTKLDECREGQKSLSDGIEALKAMRLSFSLFKINETIHQLENSLSYLKDAERVLLVKMGRAPESLIVQKTNESGLFAFSFLFARFFRLFRYNH